MLHFLTASFIFHETEVFRRSGVTQNSRHRVLFQKTVIVGQCNPSHFFQCYSECRSVSHIHLGYHLMFHFLLFLSYIMKQKDLEDLVLSIIVIIAFFVSGLLYLVKVSLRIRFNAIQFSKHDVSLILITISSSVFSLLLSYLMDQKDLEALVLSIIFISMFSVRILL